MSDFDLESLKKEISDAEMVLVGLGDAFDTFNLHIDEELVSEVLRQEGLTHLRGMISEVYGKAFDAELSGLAGLLQGKNYFVISQATNEAITRVNWRDGRLVMVCGSSLKKQCAFACEGSEPQKLSEEERMRLKAACREFVNAITVKERRNPAFDQLPENVREAMMLIQMRENIVDAARTLKKKSQTILGKCEACGAKNVLNVIHVHDGKYDQRGYAKEWNLYTKWLGGSMNRKLLMLEVGCGDSYPGVIREPFQKISELNLKSKILKINENVIDCLGKL